MIGFIRGRMVAKEGQQITVLVRGLGLELTVPASYAKVMPEPDLDHPVEGNCWVHTHITEGNIRLFGFPGPKERDAFRILLSVQNIGPTTALFVLSGMEIAELVRAVEERDSAAFAAVRGVGTKLSERRVVELQGKTAGIFIRDEIPPARITILPLLNLFPPMVLH